MHDECVDFTMHNDFMLAALEQAWLGRGICAPNPSVGAVAVLNDEIIARAWHRGAGTAHAEQLILEQIPVGLANVVLYVTLEPCNHWGRTSPCVDAIIQRGVSHVVYGFYDPNPLVSINNTPAILQKNGIMSTYYPLKEIDDFYQSYQYWTLTKKPWVTVKLAQTLDGKIAGHKGQRCHLSNSECHEFTHQQRLHADVILTTAKTVKHDNPQLNVRLKGYEQSKPLAIIDSRLSLSREARLLNTNQPCHIYHDAHYSVTNPYPHCEYYAIPAKDGFLDLSAVLDHLGELGYHDVWVEGGAELFSALHRDKLVQRTYLYVVPKLLGDDATSGFKENTIFSRQHIVSWQTVGDNAIACFDWLEP